jgi:hypothetical protein
VAGDGSLKANIYINYVDGDYELEFAGTGKMKDWNAPLEVPWFSEYNNKNKINYLIITRRKL